MENKEKRIAVIALRKWNKSTAYIFDLLKPVKTEKNYRTIKTIYVVISTQSTTETADLSRPGSLQLPREIHSEN